MTASRVTKSQKKQRLEWAMKKIDQGVGFSELASLVAEAWGVLPPERPSCRD